MLCHEAWWETSLQNMIRHMNHALLLPVQQLIKTEPYVCVDMGLWDLRCAPPRWFRTMLYTIDLRCPPLGCIVHHGAQGGPLSVRSGVHPRHTMDTFLGGWQQTYTGGAQGHACIVNNVWSWIRMIFSLRIEFYFEGSSPISQGTLKTKSWSKWVKSLVATGHHDSVGNIGHNSSSD